MQVIIDLFNALRRNSPHTELMIETVMYSDNGRVLFISGDDLFGELRIHVDGAGRIILRQGRGDDNQIGVVGDTAP